MEVELKWGSVPECTSSPGVGCQSSTHESGQRRCLPEAGGHSGTALQGPPVWRLPLRLRTDRVRSVWAARPGRGPARCTLQSSNFDPVLGPGGCLLHSLNMTAQHPRWAGRWARSAGDSGV